ncbi:MAG TPA: hypothetical protein VFJ52_06080, partial [Terriglobia bacterium]|nr:hypothetical protein [Terriglobia bacterium]
LMEELKAMFRVCAHIKKDGVRCNSPAMKGMNFCYQHIGGNIRELTRARSIYSGPKLDLLYPGFRQAIQHNLHVVAQAINDGHIDLQTANTYNRIYSACERNLRRFEDLYQEDAEAELAPIPDETDFPYTAPTQSEGGPLNPSFGLSGEQAADENLGAPFKRSLSGDDNAGAPSLRAVCERVGEQDASPHIPEGGPLKPAVGLSGEQKQPSHAGAPQPALSSTKSLEETWEASNQQPTTPTESTTPEQQPTFDTKKIDFKKYNSRFDVLERLYSSKPDYIDRLRGAILQIHKEEEQAWRAAGCPS